MSLYQKYRAKTFEEILTQSHITKVLQSSLKSQNFGHAYLFVGTRGAGKTSIARIFARAINCEDLDFVKKNGEPCNKCPSCLASLESNHSDIIEMDAASNRGIEEIRSLKESIDFVPSVGKYKVYIIDEVHMMTKEAFNALLKTLEEPPKHAVFIMCTTEMYKLPSTIISRSQVFELKFASVNEISEKIQKILKSESREMDPKGIELIANLGRGSFRDTESILEKVLNSSNEKLFNIDDVIQILGMSSFLLIQNVKESIYLYSLQNIQDQIANNLDEGNIQNFVKQLAESVYLDIVAELTSSQKTDAFKLELFDFLSTLDVQVRNTTSPKLVFIAKILNFIKKYSSEVNLVSPKNTPVELKHEVIKKSEDEPSIAPVIQKNNPSALLRQSRLNKIEKNTDEIAQKPSSLPESQNIQAASSNETANIEPKKSSGRISKMDFLEYLRTKNLFLHKYFSNSPFEISENKIIVNTVRKMEKDMLTKPQTKKLISDFGIAINANVELVVTSNSKDEVNKSKKVEDLNEDELKEIFE